MSSLSRKAAVALAAAAFSFIGAADAGLFRAYLSQSGADANPCTLSEPCRLLPRALAAVDSGGEIWMLDSANYNTGSVTISKSVSILAVPGALGSVVGTGGNAILVNSAGAEVALRNLKIRHLDSNQSGVVVLNAAKLIVDRCEITGFDATDRAGVAALAPTEVLVVDSLFRGNWSGLWLDFGAVAVVARATMSDNGYAIRIDPPATTTVDLAVSDSVLSHNGYGVYAVSGSNSRVVRSTVVRTVATHNTYKAFVNLCANGSTACTMTITDSVSSENQIGFWNGAGTMILSGNTGTGNSDYGVENAGGGIVRSAGNNVFYNNGIADVQGVLTPLTPR
jgi:hypothetical protein